MMPDGADPCQEFSDLYAENDQLKAQLAECKAVFKDMAEHGTRFDLNPTVGWRDEDSLARSYLGYIKCMDDSVRYLAREMLKRMEGA
jgi:hypothetical protein